MQSADAGTLRGEDGDNLASAKSGSLAQAFGDRLAEARAATAALAACSARENEPRQVPTAQAYSASLTKSDRFPADHMKSSVARTTPLSGAARALLDGIRLLEMKQSTLIFGSCRRGGSVARRTAPCKRSSARRWRGRIDASGLGANDGRFWLLHLCAYRSAHPASLIA